jgi:two-component system, OmpR family, alkaline phosphatase synthesis response regulator PhoP
MPVKSLIKILLVDDDTDIQEFITYNLKKENYQVYNANNGLDAIKIAQEIKPDLIILDVMMPDLNGIETCQQIREIESLNDVIICFLSARGEDFSQIAGYDAGADDYITKPIRPNILIKKVNSLLRRKNTKQIIINSLTINPDKYEVVVEDKSIVLPKKEFKLLELLIANFGKVVGRDEIYNQVWGDDIVVGDRTIDVHIRKLRKKIGDKYIKTFKGIGYKFEDSVD